MPPMLQILFSAHDSLREITPCALIFTAAALHAYAPHHQLRAWERVKAHQLSAVEAHRATTFVRWSAILMMSLGTLLLGFVYWHAQQ